MDVNEELKFLCENSKKKFGGGGGRGRVRVDVGRFTKKKFRGVGGGGKGVRWGGRVGGGPGWMLTQC